MQRASLLVLPLVVIAALVLTTRGGGGGEESDVVARAADEDVDRPAGGVADVTADASQGQDVRRAVDADDADATIVDERSALLQVRTVAATDGSPLASIELQVAEVSDRDERVQHRATSDASGVARIEVEPDRAWSLWIPLGTGHGATSMDVEPIDAGETREVVVRVPVPGDRPWYGRVTRDGVAVAAARVELVDHTGDGEPRTVTAESSGPAGLVRFDATSFHAQDARVVVPGVGLTVCEIREGHEAPDRAQPLPLWPVGRVEVTVVDPVGAPLEGVDVTVSARAYLLAPPNVEDAYQPRVASRAKTGPDGVALLADVPAEVPCDVELRRDGDLALHEIHALVVGAGETVERRYVLGGAGAIEGEVLGVDGRPLADVAVELCSDAHESETPRLHSVAWAKRATAHTRSDASGRFRFDDVAYGHWHVAADPSDVPEAQVVLAAPARLSADSPSANVTLRATAATFIAGRVVDETGAPVANTSINCWSETDGGGPLTRTDDDGSFRLEPLTEGTYHVHPRAWSSFVNEPAIEVLAGTDDLVIRLTTGARIEGEVRDAATGELVTDVQVHAYAFDGERPNFPFGIDYAHDGTFELVGLPEGAIAIRATNDDGEVGILTGVRVQYGEPTKVEVRLERAVPLRIRYSGSREGAAALVMQDGATMTYVTIGPGESTTCQVLPGAVSVAIVHDDGRVEREVVDVARGAGASVVLSD